MKPTSCVLCSVPSRLLAPVAKIAYGTGKIGWRGVSTVKLVAPMARTPMSSQ